MEEEKETDIVSTAKFLITSGEELHNTFVSRFSSRTPGRDVLARKILTEIRVLKKKVLCPSKLELDNVTSSNLHQLGAVVRLGLALGPHKVGAFLKKLRDEDEKHFYVDIVTKHGLLWLKVVCRSPNNLQLLHVLDADKSPLRQGLTLQKLTCKVVKQKVVMVFCKGVSNSVCDALRRSDILVMTPRLIADKDLSANSFRSDCDSDDESDGCVWPASVEQIDAVGKEVDVAEKEVDATDKEVESTDSKAGMCSDAVLVEFAHHLLQFDDRYSNTSDGSSQVANGLAASMFNNIYVVETNQAETQCIPKSSGANQLRTQDTDVDKSSLANDLWKIIRECICNSPREVVVPDNSSTKEMFPLSISIDEVTRKLNESSLNNTINVENCDRLIFLDVPTLIAYVSDMCNGYADNVQFEGGFLRQQQEWEMEKPLIPIIDKFCEGALVAISKEAKTRFEEVITLVAGDREKVRAKMIINRLLVLPDFDDLSSVVPVGKGVTYHSRVIFGTARHFKAPIVTANLKFVRSTQQSGLHLLALTHEPRALSERKVTQTLCEGAAGLTL